MAAVSDSIRGCLLGRDTRPSPLSTTTIASIGSAPGKGLDDAYIEGSKGGPNAVDTDPCAKLIYTPTSSNNSSTTPTTTTSTIRRLHVGSDLSGQSELILSRLDDLRRAGSYLTEGSNLNIRGSLTMVIKCDPKGGYLSEETIVYLEDSIRPARKICLICSIADLPSFFSPNTTASTTTVSSSSRAGCNRAAVSTITTSSSGPNTTTATSSSGIGSGGYCGPFRIDRLDVDGRFYGTVVTTPFSSTTSSSTANGTTIPGEMFRELFDRYLKRLLRVPRFYFYGNNQMIGDVSFFVSNIEPMNRPGYIDKNTEIYFGIDPFETFGSVTVSPLRDTLPKNYRYNLLDDCLIPFFRLNSFKVFRIGDVFAFSGVQFRITDTSLSASDSSSWLGLIGFGWKDGWLVSCPKYGRVGSRTDIIVGGKTSPNHTSVSECGLTLCHLPVADPVAPKIMDLLPSERIEIVRRSAPCYRESLLVSFASDLDENALERLYPNSGLQSLDSSTITVGSARWDDTNTTTITTSSSSGKGSGDGTCPQVKANGSIFHLPTAKRELVEAAGRMETCTICCDPILPSDTPSRTLKCGHSFHTRCVAIWTRRNKSCPNCRTNTSNSSSPTSNNYQLLLAVGRGTSPSTTDSSGKDECRLTHSFDPTTTTSSSEGGSYYKDQSLKAVGRGGEDIFNQYDHLDQQVISGSLGSTGDGSEWDLVLNYDDLLSDLQTDSSDGSSSDDSDSDLEYYFNQFNQ